MSALALRGRAPELPPAYRLVALDQVGSTNDEARRLAAAGAPEFALVWAREQTSGRGRQGRAWASPPGNLYCSLVLRPPVALARAMELSLVAALGLGEAIAPLLPQGVDLRYKWPNDLLLNERKVSGILLESSLRPDGALDFLVLGTGVNIESYPAQARLPATSLHAAGVQGIDAGFMLEAYVRQFQLWYTTWLAQDLPPVRAQWQRRAWRLGERLEMNLGEASLAGRFDGLAPDGAMVLTLDDGTQRRVNAGEVAAARAA
ncbi:MAG: biotin--[acetyl-CoA-carboxylase] ligase [Rhodospirillales bacterium]|nr:biotin--[acetyl-CoA-carboxylase] ligase [Rhodospirillales bacterium]